jgi:hypothetical protein
MSIPWFHKSANLKYEVEITKEFQNALHILYPEFDLTADISHFKAGVKMDEVKKLMPLLSSILKEEGLYDTWIATSFISASPGSQINPHIDAPPSPTFHGRTFALNWPVFNCETSITSFYNIIDDKNIIDRPIKYDPNGSHYRVMKYPELEFADSVILSKPTWLRVDQPHDVKVFGNSTRLAASLRFTPEPFDYHRVPKHSFM